MALNDRTLGRIGEFFLVLALVVAAYVVGLLGAYLAACGALLDAMVFTLIVSLMTLVVPQVLIAQLVVAALVHVLLAPFSTARRRRWVARGVGPALLLVLGAGAIAASRFDMAKCSLGVWN